MAVDTCGDAPRD